MLGYVVLYLHVLTKKFLRKAQASAEFCLEKSYFVQSGYPVELEQKNGEIDR